MKGYSFSDGAKAFGIDVETLKLILDGKVKVESFDAVITENMLNFITDKQTIDFFLPILRKKASSKDKEALNTSKLAEAIWPTNADFIHLVLEGIIRVERLDLTTDKGEKIVALNTPNAIMQFIDD